MSTADEQQSVVTARGVWKRFGERAAVAELDLSVEPGLCFGLLGPNGAGKTTSMRMIYGATRPTSGEIRVFGLDVVREPRAVRARLGVTLQENVLIEPLSPEENLRVFGRYHLLPESQLSRRVDELMDFLELRSHSGLPVLKLSGGFKRRLSIALSLVNDPELLLLDEPTTGLDPAVRLAVWERVRELRRRGKTILLTTHYMDEAERLCDRVAIFSQGRSVCEGPPRDLIAQHLAAEAVELDCNAEEERSLFDASERFLRLRTGNRLTVFTEDATPLIARVHGLDGGERRPLIVRPANLEDVFLSVTGARLEEGA